MKFSNLVPRVFSLGKREDPGDEVVKFSSVSRDNLSRAVFSLLVRRRENLRYRGGIKNENSIETVF